MMRELFMWAIVACLCSTAVLAQQTAGNTNEKRVGLSEAAVALDSNDAPALEATLSTKSLNGGPDAPVTNIRMVVRNASSIPLAFVSGIVTFYDAAGVRCGEGIFKADALAVKESFETDTPGIRIRCSAASWRIVATDLLPRIAPSTLPPPSVMAPSRLLLSVDGETHPIQIDKPITVTLGERQRTIVLRTAP